MIDKDNLANTVGWERWHGFYRVYNWINWVVYHSPNCQNKWQD